MANIRQIRYPQIAALGFQINGLGILHGRLVLSGGLQRIRYAHERTPGIWLWNVTVKIPGSPRTPAPESSSRQTSPLEMK